MHNNFLPLKKNNDFRTIYNKGKSISTKYLVLYYKETNFQGRIGFVASKKVGKAVIRNKYKRLMKEAFRVAPLKFNNSVDLIILARPRITEANFYIIKKDLIYLVKRLNKIMVEKKDD